MNPQKQTPEPDPNDPELIMLDRILSRTADFIFPLSEEELTATDEDVARLMKSIRSIEQKTQPDIALGLWSRILLFPERMLAVAASLFYMAGGGLLYTAIRNAAIHTEALARENEIYTLPNSFLGHTARVCVVHKEPPLWPYILSGVLLLGATLLLIAMIRSIRSRRRKSDSL